MTDEPESEPADEHEAEPYTSEEDVQHEEDVPQEHEIDEGEGDEHYTLDGDDDDDSEMPPNRIKPSPALLARIDSLNLGNVGNRSQSPVLMPKPKSLGSTRPAFMSNDNNEEKENDEVPPPPPPPPPAPGGGRKSI